MRLNTRLTYCPWHHPLSRHQVVIQPLQAAVQGVRDPPLMVIEGGVHGLLLPQRAAGGLLIRHRERGDRYSVRTSFPMIELIAVSVPTSFFMINDSFIKLICQDVYHSCKMKIKQKFMATSLPKPTS